MTHEKLNDAARPDGADITDILGPEIAQAVDRVVSTTGVHELTAVVSIFFATSEYLKAIDGDAASAVAGHCWGQIPARTEVESDAALDVLADKWGEVWGKQ